MRMEEKLMKCCAESDKASGSDGLTNVWNLLCRYEADQGFAYGMTVVKLIERLDVKPGNWCAPIPPQMRVVRIFVD